MDFKRRPMQPASPVPSAGSADLNNLGVDSESQARIKQLEVMLKAKDMDNESLEARLREFERERFELYGELEELKKSDEAGGRIVVLEDEVQDLEDQLALANSRALEIEIKYNRAMEEYGKKLRNVEQEPAQGLQEQANVKEDQLSAALRALSGQIGAYESQTKKLEYEVEILEGMVRIKDNEYSNLQDELQFVKKELKNSTTEYERSSRALRILSGRIAFLEMECGSLGLQVDSFDMERCELYRENLTLMDTISEQVLEIDGLRRLIKKLEKNSSQTSGTKQEIKMVKEVANNSQSDAQISMDTSNEIQNIIDNQDLKLPHGGDIPLSDKDSTPQDTSNLSVKAMKFMVLGAVGIAVVAIVSRLCL